MNPFKPAKIEWLTFFALSPVLVTIMNRLLFADNFLSIELLLKSYPLIFIYLLISWYLHVTVMHILRLKLPLFNQTYKRILYLFSSHIFFTTSSLLLIFWTYNHFHLFGYVIDYDKAKWCIVIGVVLTFVATSTWEGSYIYQLWKESLREKELLQKMNLQNELDALKSQVNPHFLFNSLNSLSSLIQENPHDAEKFLDEMSKVYRYILKNNEQELIDLSTELKFLQSYQHLLKTRYRDGLHIAVEAEKNSETYCLPPLTLQLLLENAVKHNVIMKNRPLKVTIAYEGNERLIVKNNLQKKTSKIPSNKVGLTNIAMKYKLLNQPEVIISETTEEFSVSIPLIKMKENEIINN